MNDNKMSISENVGGLSRYLGQFRTADAYRDLKTNVMEILNHIPNVGPRMVKRIRNTKSSIKQLLIPGMFFEEMGITYYGPVDGHDLGELDAFLRVAKQSDGPVLLWGGIIVLLMGICLAVYYLSFGVFYDGETFLLSRFGKKDITYRFDQIKGQKLYLVQGGNIIIELHMTDGGAVSLQSTMDGVYPFLDTAFSGWCRQKGLAEDQCDFHDPSKSWWFPHEES